METKMTLHVSNLAQLEKTRESNNISSMIYLECDSLARERLNEDLHATAQTEHEMEGGLLLNVVV